MGRRNISFSLTLDQVRARTKTVTRRSGWAWLEPGTQLTGVERGMGLKKGEKVKPVCAIEVVSVRRERIDAIDDADVEREGFPGRDAAWFVEKYCRSQSVHPATMCTRIEFKYIDVPCPECGYTKADAAQHMDHGLCNGPGPL